MATREPCIKVLQIFQEGLLLSDRTALVPTMKHQFHAYPTFPVLTQARITWLLAIFVGLSITLTANALKITAQPENPDSAGRWVVPGVPGVYTIPIRFESDVFIPPLYYELTEPILVSEGDNVDVTVNSGPWAGMVFNIQYSANSGNLYIEVKTGQRLFWEYISPMLRDPILVNYFPDDNLFTDDYSQIETRNSDWGINDPIRYAIYMHELRHYAFQIEYITSTTVRFHRIYPLNGYFSGRVAQMERDEFDLPYTDFRPSNFAAHLVSQGEEMLIPVQVEVKDEISAQGQLFVWTFEDTHYYNTGEIEGPETYFDKTWAPTQLVVFRESHAPYWIFTADEFIVGQNFRWDPHFGFLSTEFYPFIYIVQKDIWFHLVPSGNKSFIQDSAGNWYWIDPDLLPQVYSYSSSGWKSLNTILGGS